MSRQLSLSHFAFFRGHLEGLPLATLAQRYLRDEPDETRPKRTLQFVRDALRALAMQHGQLRYARALAIDPARLVAPAVATGESGAPSLEAFRQAVDPGGFYGEAELIDLFQQQAGQRRPDRRQQRAARLRALQLEALEFLQLRARPVPRPEHAVEAWLPPRLAIHLMAAGIQTLGDLVSRMNRGYRWWETVPGIGAEKAARLRRWLAPHSAVDGLALAPTAAVPRERLGTALELLARRAVRTEIAPLERFLLPRDLDGSQGRLRADPRRQQISARDDHEAIAAWLNARATNDNTYRAYRREAERLLLWCVFDRRKALSSLTVEDCSLYRDFLQAPPAGWVSPRNVERWSPAWRPLSGPLAPRSQRTAFTIVSALFDWLVSQQYLVANPWKALPRPGRAPTLDLSRAFTHAQWAAIRQVVDALPDPVRRSRMRLVTELLYHTGLRRAELVAADLGDLREEMFDGEPCWVLTVTGKGGRIREVPIVEAVMRQLDDDLVLRGLPPDPRDGPASAPLVAAIGQGDAASDRSFDRPPGSARAPRGIGQARSTHARLPVAQLYRELKRIFAAAGARLQAEGARGAARVAQGSPHWLRHTFATHAIETVAPDVVGSVLGHASMATTTLYTRTELRRKARGLRAFGAQPGQPSLGPGLSPPASRSRG